VDARADVWALGIVLYELLTEVPPFGAETLMAVSARVLRDDPTPLSQYRPDVAPGLVAVILQCLQKDPARRWPTVAAFSAALAPFAPASMQAYVGRVARVQGVQIEPERPTVELGVEPAKVTTTARSAAASAPEVIAVADTAAGTAAPVARRRSGAATALGVVAAVVVIGAVGIAGLRARSGPTPASSNAVPATATSSSVPVTSASEQGPVAASAAMPTVVLLAPTASSPATARPSATTPGPRNKPPTAPFPHVQGGLAVPPWEGTSRH
jgi:serine/threonine-protein kinase